MRFREDKPADLDRARAAVAARREQNPAGTQEQMLAALGPGFHRDYAVVLRAVLFAADKVTTLLDGVAVAAESIDSGAARRALEQLARVSHEVAA